MSLMAGKKYIMLFTIDKVRANGWQKWGENPGSHKGKDSYIYFKCVRLVGMTLSLLTQSHFTLFLTLFFTFLKD